MKFMKFSCVLLWVLLPIQASGWENTYGSIYKEEIYSMAIDKNNDEEKYYIMCGFAYTGPMGPYNFMVTKIDQDGDSVWMRNYGATNAGGIIVSNDEGYTIAGYGEYISARYPLRLIKLSYEGEVLWDKEYGITSGIFTSASVIQVISGKYVAMWCCIEGYIFLVKTDSIGDSLWTKPCGREGSWGYCIRETQDSGYIIAARTSVGPMENDLYVVKADYEGNLIWDVMYGGIGENAAYYIDTTSDGNYIITGKTSLYYSVLFDVYLLKINDDGDTLWTRKIGGEDESDIGRCVRPTTDGGYIITGWTYSYGIGTPDSSNVYLIKTDSEGYVEWEQTYGGTGEDKGYSVSQTDDGGYIIAGVYDQGPHTDVYLIKTDSLGNVDWIQEPGMKPKEISLNVYPNPFNSSCAIAIDGVGAWRAMPLQIEIFDLRGNLIETLDKTPCMWQPDEEIGSGIYLVRASAGEKTVSKKIVFLR